MSSRVEALFPVARPVIGMLHAPPLPGSPRYGGNLEAILARVVGDAQALASGGAHGLLLENFGDAPFFPAAVPAATVAHLAALAVEVRRQFNLPLGINVLRNDGRAALAIAQAAGAQFIRVNVLCGARVTDQGLIQGIAHDLLRDRRQLGADSVCVFADVDVKHSAPLAARPLADEVHDLIERGLADALIMSGAATGQPPDPQELQVVCAAAGETPVFVGSGVGPENLSDYLPPATGIIVGSSLKAGGIATQAVDRKRVRQLMAAWRKLT